KQDPPLPPESEWRVHYRTRAAELQARERDGSLTVRDRVDLSAYYIRLTRYDEAVQGLTPGEGVGGPHRVLVLAHLAPAHQMAGRLDRAEQYLRQALDAWPSMWYGFSREQLNFYRRAEQYQLKLLHLRQQESRLQPRPHPETVDALFPGVNFVGRGGQYTPGELAPDQYDELPPDAVMIVTQLVWWVPFADRVYCLLGELLNAEGKVSWAATILDELVYGRRFSARAAAEHRQVLLKARKDTEALIGTDQKPARSQLLLWWVAPRGAGLAPGAAGLMEGTGQLSLYS